MTVLEADSMCGRYAFHSDADFVAKLFGLAEIPEFLTPRFNIAPSQKVPVVAAKPDGVTRKLGQLSWGLLPSWANDRKIHRPINARAETVASSGMFSTPFRTQRCLIPASGFYEWQAVAKKKQPHYIRMKDGHPFAFAGLWDMWSEGETKVITCCSITTTPNELMVPIHNRMPVIIAAEHYTDWLAVHTPLARLKELLTPYPSDAMEAFAVSSYVSKATNEGSKCIEALSR